MFTSVERRPHRIEEIEEIQTTPPPASDEMARSADPETPSITTDHIDAHVDANEEFQFVELERIETPGEEYTDEAGYGEEIKMSEPPPLLPDIALPDSARQGLTAHLFASAAVAESAGEVEMVEIKRLMGEIARTVEDAIRAVSQHSNFAMHLRAGQLRVADRYPFLDPFGNEFEYLAGEIAFVGKVKPDDFINGLTEALRIALASAIQSVGQPARLRRVAAEDLRSLGQRHRSEFEEFGLDQSVERIIEA